MDRPGFHVRSVRRIQAWGSALLPPPPPWHVLVGPVTVMVVHVGGHVFARAHTTPSRTVNPLRAGPGSGFTHQGPFPPGTKWMLR